MTLRRADRGKLRVYEWPQPGESYTIGVDVSEGKIRDATNKLASLLTQGKQTPDRSAICVLNTRTLNQAACYVSLEVPAIFAHKVYGVCKIYTNHFVAVEANGPGLAVIQELEIKGIRKLLQRTTYDKVNRVQTLMKGFKTTAASREPLIRNFYESVLADDGVRLNDTETIQEFLTIKYNNNGKPEAAPGCYDDLGFATMIALEARRLWYRPKPYQELKYTGLPMQDRRVWEQLDKMTESRETKEFGVDSILNSESAEINTDELF